jgi:tRNA(Arg) A34 adenosine deaminase TadA
MLPTVTVNCSPPALGAPARGSALHVSVVALVPLTVLLGRKRVVSITLPPWLWEYYNGLSDETFESDEAMMAVAVEISKRNVEHATGGPFGCAIFERTIGGTTKLFAVGANRVTTLNNSTLHGETVAIQFAEQKLKSFSLRPGGDKSNKEYILCTSCEPCAMCLGSIMWASPSEMHCAATKEDAEAIGFDEGPVFPESYKHLEASGIKIKRRILRTEGKSVLDHYKVIGVMY